MTTSQHSLKCDCIVCVREILSRLVELGFCEIYGLAPDGEYLVKAKEKD